MISRLFGSLRRGSGPQQTLAKAAVASSDSAVSNPIIDARLEQTSYEQRIANEIHNYHGAFQQNDTSDEIRRTLWKVGAFEYSMSKYSAYLQSKMPQVAVTPYVHKRIEKADRAVRILTLGCATGDWELQIAQKYPDKCEVTLVDLSQELLEEGARYGEKHNLHVRIDAADVNKYEIEPNYYDFIVCRSSLHHFMMLERVLDQIHDGLNTDGAFLVIGEWVGRNGLQMYPETEVIAQELFRALPDRLRLNSYTREIDTRLPNIDHSVNSFEAVRSEEILPGVLKKFRPFEYVAYDTLVTLFFDFRYGSNYNLEDEFDRATVERITALDIEYLKSGTLRPTAMCGIFQKA